MARLFTILAVMALLARSLPAQTKPGALSGQLTVSVSPAQLADVPIIFDLTVKNTGADAFSYWCGGPGIYPPATWFTITLRDAEGRQHELQLTNGQYEQGSGHGIAIAPSEAVKLPAAAGALRPGKYALVAVTGGAQGYLPPGGGPRVTTWPAMEAKLDLAIEVREDPKAAQAWAQDLLDRVRKDEPFARHVAMQYRVATVVDAMVRDLDSPDPATVSFAATTLYQLRQYPAGLGSVIRRAIESQLAANSPDPARCVSSLASLAEIEGSDASLEALIACVHGPQRSHHPEMVGHIRNFRQPRALEALRELLKDPDPQWRFSAASALAWRGDPAAIPELLAAAERPETRSGVLRLLADCWRDDRVLPAIERWTNDPAPEVREAAHAARESVLGARQREKGVAPR